MKQYPLFLIAALCLLLPVSAQQSKQLLILQTSDMHSRIEPIDPQSANVYANKGGMVRRATFVEQARKENPDLLLFDCGDFSQGTPYYNLYQGEVEMKLMNHIGYDAITIGNHEFDFGLENMARLFKEAEFPVVCANYDVKGTVLEGLVKPYIVLKRNGLKIGVFGVGPQLEGLVQADKYVGVVFSDPIASAQKVTDLLRGKEQCDVVICLSHLGYLGEQGDENLVRKTRGIDAVLGGHSHTFMNKPAVCLNKEGANVPVLHSGKSGIFVGKMKLSFQ